MVCRHRNCMDVHPSDATEPPLSPHARTHTHTRTHTDPKTPTHTHASNTIPNIAPYRPVPLSMPPTTPSACTTTVAVPARNASPSVAPPHLIGRGAMYVLPTHSTNAGMATVYRYGGRGRLCLVPGCCNCQYQAHPGCLTPGSRPHAHLQAHAQQCPSAPLLSPSPVPCPMTDLTARLPPATY